MKKSFQRNKIKRRIKFAFFSNRSIIKRKGIICFFIFLYQTNKLYNYCKINQSMQKILHKIQQLIME
ncbi:ribonuclease P protein component [Blattabacterium cuenoti]|uniref:ribonuclease P protein component n=1 Tax=Blattabacterium cuenoti TaxID=1653831 RepID=UPI00163BF542